MIPLAVRLTGFPLSPLTFRESTNPLARGVLGVTSRRKLVRCEYNVNHLSSRVGQVKATDQRGAT